MTKSKLSKSGVSWTDYSWGVVDGCTKVSEACKNCYAEAMVTRFQPDRKFSEVHTHPERLEAPLNTKKGGKVFVAPLGDLFHPDVPFEFIDKVFAVMTLCPQHTFQVLTKRPERMLEYFSENRDCSILAEMQETTSQLDDIKDEEQIGRNQVEELRLLERGLPLRNFWLGVTAENQEQWDIRTAILRHIPAAVRFVSIEPMLSNIDMHLLRSDYRIHILEKSNTFPYVQHSGKYGNMINWVILGGESGKNARPMHPEWARSVRDQCVAAGVKFYFKQWGEFVPFDEDYIIGHSPNLPKGSIAFLNNGQTVKVAWDNIYDLNDADVIDCMMHRPGTKKAGCLLDGREWKQMPENKKQTLKLTTGRVINNVKKNK